MGFCTLKLHEVSLLLRVTKSTTTSFFFPLIIKSMARTFGKVCSLFIADGSDWVALSLCEETLRESVSGYFVPPAVGGKKLGAFVEAGADPAGCFIVRLDKATSSLLFALLKEPEREFELLVSRGRTNTRFSGLRLTAASLWASHAGSVYMKGEIEGAPGCTVSQVSALAVGERVQPYVCNMRSSVIDGVTFSDLRGFRLSVDFKRNAEYTLKIFGYLSDEFSPTLEEIGEASFELDWRTGASLKVTRLVARSTLCDVITDNAVLMHRRFAVNGAVDYAVL